MKQSLAMQRVPACTSTVPLHGTCIFLTNEKKKTICSRFIEIYFVALQFCSFYGLKKKAGLIKQKTWISTALYRRPGFVFVNQIAPPQCKTSVSQAATHRPLIGFYIAVWLVIDTPRSHWCWFSRFAPQKQTLANICLKPTAQPWRTVTSTWQQCKSMFVATATTTNLTLRNPRHSCSVRKGQISALTHFLKRSDVKLDITACHPLLYLSFDRILYKFFIIIIFLDWYSFCQFTSLLCERCCKFVLENFAFCK